MIPEGIGGLIAFLAFVAPGALYELLAARGAPRPADTTFREANRVVLASVLASLGAAALLLAPRWWFPSWQRALVDAVRVGGDHWRQQAGEVAGGLLLWLAAAMILAWVMAYVRVRQGPGGTNYDESQWYLVFRRHKPDNAVVNVIAVSAAGERHHGDLLAYTTDAIEPAARDLTLKAPIHWAPDATTKPKLLQGVQRVVLNGEQAARVYVTYRTRSPDEAQ